MKVYCDDCKYIECLYWDRAVCNHPGNLKFHDHWYSSVVTYKKSPRRLNKKNDCPNYESNITPPTKVICNGIKFACAPGGCMHSSPHVKSKKCECECELVSDNKCTPIKEKK